MRTISPIRTSAFRGAQLERRAKRRREGPPVDAHQVGGRSGLPDHNKRPLAEVEFGGRGVWSHDFFSPCYSPTPLRCDAVTKVTDPRKR